MESGHFFNDLVSPWTPFANHHVIVRRDECGSAGRDLTPPSPGTVRLVEPHLCAVRSHAPPPAILISPWRRFSTAGRADAGITPHPPFPERAFAHRHNGRGTGAAGRHS